MFMTTWRFRRIASKLCHAWRFEGLLDKLKSPLTLTAIRVIPFLSFKVLAPHDETAFPIFEEKDEDLIFVWENREMKKRKWEMVFAWHICCMCIR
jgi:hypothetical protein